ncbi:MAG: 4-hydroxy-tetrahydrodipicolinate reductase [Alphaproteobacteria bacterium]|nr:4-hydroxy-tetrahydrodipicolinate reductase [Alphaproteobacteria bacterium]
MNIGVLGCTGRVGALIVKELLSGDWDARGLTLVGGTVRDTRKVGAAEYFVTDKAEELFERADVLIDFTLPEATADHIALAAAHKKTLIIGTSGVRKEDEAAMVEAAKATPIIYAANMSVGVNLLIALVEQAAARLGPEWDAEILDLHHKYKVDAPSGTSYALARAILKGRGEDETSDDKLVLAREGHTGPREQGTIGFSVQRGGDVIAENSALFFGQGERLEITHRAQDRAIFAKGALRAALWSAGKAPGLYSMRDVLGI